MSDEYYREVADKFIFTVKKNLLYTENDVWINIKDGKAQIGVTDFLQRRGGDAVFVELPKKGSNVRRLEEIANFETMKTVLSVISPFNGVITEVNTSLNDKPELINEDPYGVGWLVLISPSNLQEDKRHLMTAEKYFELMKSKIKDEHKTSRKEV
ncbi:MAG: glycine cleavage system protein H [Candidatus Thorarchaeota archaeon]|jgi:glycine cleavage system H protein